MEDVAALNKYKPDYAGFIMSSGYRRSVNIEQAAELVKALDKGIKAVGVFVNEDAEYIRAAVKGADLYAVQLHGDEDEEYISKLSIDCEIWKAVRAKSGADVTDVKGADRLLLDKYDPSIAGGTGESFARSEVGEIKTSLPLILAGGLNAENVQERIALFKPSGVDVSSAVETDGFKDEQKIKEFIYKVRELGNEQNR